jgi:Flp pilus assembly protein TadD
MARTFSSLLTVAVAAGFALAGAGCVNTSSSLKPQVAETGISLEEIDPEQKLELPPKEKAKASMATAQMLDKRGKANEAIALYERARALDSSYNRVCRRLAVLYDRYGNFTKADEEYAKALEMFPKDPTILNDAGYSQYCRGNWTMAEDYLRHAVELKPDFQGAWVNLGMTLAQRDRLDAAMEAFAHAISEPEAYCNLAFVYTSQGKYSEAAAAYRQALRLNPGLKLAQEALARLKQGAYETPTAAAQPATSHVARTQHVER